MPPDGRPRKTKTVDNASMSEATTRRPGTRKEDWITLQFRRVYDDALQDSLPPEMLELLNELDEKADPSSRKSDPDEGGNA